MRKPGLALAAIVIIAPQAIADVDVREAGNTLEVSVNGKLFSVYRFGESYTRPFFWPIQGPHGDPVTRAYPNIPDAPGEARDHPWHRGLSFTHGEVGPPGTPPIDFWREGVANQGRIIHRTFDPRPKSEGKTVVFGVRNDWVGPDRAVLLEEHSLWRIDQLDGNATRISTTIQLTAKERPIQFGDTDEGSFSVRVATSMDEKSESTGPRAARPRGRITNSEGAVGASKCWGRTADWADYSGPVNQKVVGLALFDHPDNQPRARWHVRDYGLFSANAFGKLAFDPTLKGEKRTGVILNPGQPLVLRYALLVHPGDAKEAEVGRHYRDYLQIKKDYHAK